MYESLKFFTSYFSSLLECLIKRPKIYKTYFHLTVHHDSLYLNSRVTKNFSYWAKLSLKSYKTYIIASPKIAKLLQGVFIFIRVFVDFLWAFHSFKKFPIGFYIPPIFPYSIFIIFLSLNSNFSGPLKMMRTLKWITDDKNSLIVVRDAVLL